MTYNRGYGAGDALSGGGASRSGTDGTSLIDQNSFFNGIYRSPRDLRIEGQFEGEIQCEGTVVIADTARVSGTIRAGNVRISGAVDGEVTCADRFEILASGQVTAHVLAGSVIVRDGAYYEGEMRMHQEPEGLPQREVTATAAPIERISGRAGRKSATEGAGAAGDIEPSEPAPNGRELSEAPTLRAVPDA